MVSGRGYMVLILLHQLELLRWEVHISIDQGPACGTHTHFVNQITEFANTDTNASMPTQPAMTSATNNRTSIIPRNHFPRILVAMSTSPGRAGIATQRRKRLEKTTAGTTKSIAI